MVSNKQKPRNIESKKNKNENSRINASKTNDIFIVALGASAGGLDALERFFAHLPCDAGMAFVVIPHLDPKHDSLMQELLQKKTKMEVIVINDGISLIPDKIYVVPPNRDLSILNGTLQLAEPSKTAKVRMPIDFFFQSLAQDQGSQAVGIILSGMGTDGTLGTKAIKGELGMTMAQEPKSAKFNSMPQSAFNTGLVDYVLPPEEMPTQLIKYAKGMMKNGFSTLLPKQQEIFNDLQKIFILLRNQTQHDFSAYKQNTIIRRIERRMAVHQIEEISIYIRFLRENPNEVENLFKELLIGVTSFFRDPEAFEILKNEVLPSILENKPKDYIIRVWVPGCSTGEESYSIAMVLRECTEKLNRHFTMQVFATDIDVEAIDKARAGLYSASILPDVGPERMSRFFISEDNAFRIKKDIREMLIFAPQNIIKDPPFTKLDLICCRNLLIYFNGSLQKKLMPLFHYSLNANGALFLGTSETIGMFTDLFRTMDKKWKIFQKMGTRAGQSNIQFPIVSSELRGLQTETLESTELNISQRAEKALLSRFAPPSVIINGDGYILYVHGRTGNYLELSPGEARWNLCEMAREGLKMELPLAIRKAKSTQEEVVVKDLDIRANGGTLKVDLIVKPLMESSDASSALIVTFKEKPAKQSDPLPDDKSSKTKSVKETKTLEKELQYTKESLQTSIEELETSNEELKSTNEELQSTNEELQSTNEELETSKEEQQSLNEELITVNSELQGKIEELTTTNNDMKNLLNSINVPTLFLDNNLCIKRYTSFARKVINLIQSDIGRPLGDISIKLKDVDIVKIATDVLNDLKFREQEVETIEGDWYQMRILPYRTAENVIDGVVVRFQDLTEHKQIELKLKTSEERLKLIQQMSGEGIFEIDTTGKIVFANDALSVIFGHPIDELIKKPWVDFLHPNAKMKWKDIQKRALIGELVSGESTAIQKNRQDMPFSFNTGPIYRDNQLVGLIGTIQKLEKHDQTSRSRHETGNKTNFNS